MIKFLINIILIFFILTSISFATDSNHTIYSTEKNTSINIKKTKLLENYVYNLYYNLLRFKDKYNIKGNYEVDQIQKELSIIIDSLKKIQTTNIKISLSERVKLEVIRRLKILTPKLKNILNKKKQKFILKSVKTKGEYIKITEFLSNKILSIIIYIYKPLKKKTIYSLSDSKKIIHLKNLLKENFKLKRIKDEKFKSENDIKRKIRNIIRNVQKEISKLKVLIN